MSGERPAQREKWAALEAAAEAGQIAREHANTVAHAPPLALDNMQCACAHMRARIHVRVRTRAHSARGRAAGGGDKAHTALLARDGAVGGHARVQQRLHDRQAALLRL